MSQLGEKSYVDVDVPEETEEEKQQPHIKVRFSVFFDGTLNNRFNIEAREKSGHDELMAEIYKKHGGDGTSYDNDYTNISKMEKYVTDDKKYEMTLSRYVEGAGSQNKGRDTYLGKGMGIWWAGIEAKTKIGLQKLIDDIRENTTQNTIIEQLTFDVFGFSRGAAGARNFIYEVLFGEQPLKMRLESKGYIVRKIEFHFVGLYDTVSSHGLSFSNDVKALHLDSVAHAKRVIHLVAADEHRKNFSLTNIKSAGAKGKEIFLPGVHSDIGGGYRDNAAEQDLIVFSGTREAAEADLRDLIASGWYTKQQLELIELDNEYGGFVPFSALLKANRNAISNLYSRIPLNIMAHFAMEEGIMLEDKFEKNAKVPPENFLLAYWFNVLKEYAVNGTSHKSDWLYEKAQDPRLCELRGKYFHFSANSAFGMGPRMKNGKRVRQHYNG